MSIDLRSDTVTRPSPGMREAMARARVGDEVWGDDPTIAELYRVMRELTGKEAALFFPSGTQSNLAAVLSHCGRGTEVILGREAHIYVYEAGGASALGSVSYWPLENAADGSLDPQAIAAAIRPDDIHFPTSRLVCLENTIGGRVLPQDSVIAAGRAARAKGLAFHLDGARAWNAAVASGLSLKALCAPFDTVSLCFSKGMGTPVGTVLVGPEDTIRSATRLRKMLGGGMRQTGILAAACLYALEHNVDRLADDHRKAERLAEGLGRIPSLKIVRQATNIVLVRVPEAQCAALQAQLDEAGIRVAVGPLTRLVTHLDVPDDAIDRVVNGFSRALAVAA